MVLASNSKMMYYGLAFLIALTGMDTVSIQPGGMTIRLAQLIFLVIFLLNIKKITIPKKPFLGLVIYVIAILPSLYFSLSPIRSIGYIIWLFLNFITILSVFSYFASNHHQILVNAFRLSYRAQILLAVVLATAGFGYGDGNNRAVLLYYEPSSFSLALTPFLGLMFFGIISKDKQDKKQALVDSIFCIIYLISSRSANFMLIMLTFYLIWLAKHYSLKKIITPIFLVFTLSSVIYDYIYTVNDFNTQAARAVLEAQNAQQAITQILMRGGNRLPRILVSYDIFTKNSIAGVGLASYEKYTEGKNYCAIYKKFNIPCTDFLDPSGLPTINLYLDILAGTGVLGAFGFVIFIISIFKKQKNIDDSIDNTPFIYAFIVILIVMNIDTNFLRPHLWMLMGIIIGLRISTTDSQNKLLA